MGISDATSSKAPQAGRKPESPTGRRSAEGYFKPRHIAAVLLMTFGVVIVSVVDTRMPTGLAPWLLYSPLGVACLWLSGLRFALVGASVCSILIIVGFLLSPHGTAIGVEVFNRALGLVALWAAVLGGRAYLRSLAEIRQQQEALSHLNGSLEQRVAERTAELTEQQQRLQAIVDTAVEGIITINERGIVDSMNAAAERMFDYRADEVIGRNVSLLMPSPYREQHDGYIARYRETGYAKIIGIGREVAGQRKDGTMFPIDLAVSEVKLGDRRIFTGLLRDLTERKRLEAAVTSSAEQERGRIARDLHDGLGQELGGALFLGNLLQRDLKERGAAEAERAAQIHTLVEKALADAREISYGLYPVPPEPDGLMTALQNLADRVTRDCRIECIFDTDSAVLLEDQTTATHLYRIAQEAVNNALKHSGTSRIDIRLAATARSLEVSVRDHGTGLPQNAPVSGGLGLQTMKHRAQLIGGQLTAQGVPDGGGVLVCCSVARVWRGTTGAAATPSSPPAEGGEREERKP